MYRVLSLVCVFVVFVHSAPAPDRLTRDKQRLSVLIQELSDVVKDLNTGQHDVETKDNEPVVDAEVSELDTEANLELQEKRKGKGKKPRPEISAGMEEKGVPRPEVTSETDNRDEDSDEVVNDLQSKDNKDLRDEIKLLLALARQRTTKDNHDWPMPFNKKRNMDEEDN